MFLLLLLAFPGFAYYLFQSYRNDPKELNGIIKIIGVVGLAMLFFGLYLFDGKEAYAVTLVFWYAIVFAYFFFTRLGIVTNRLEAIELGEKTDMGSGFINVFYLGTLLVFYITLFSSDMGRFVRSFDESGEMICYFLIVLVLFWVIFEGLDMLVNTYLRFVKGQKKYREDLKSELRKEIREDLRRDLAWEGRTQNASEA